MNDQQRVTSEIVPVSKLREHPANPRRGDITAIADSLSAHGQYRPVVAQRSTGYVLAGNHTVKAARSLGWKKVAVTWLDVDDETAAGILVADNRTSDLAAYDDGALAALLRSLPDLDGTGFDAADLDRLEGVFDRPISTPDGPAIVAEPGASRPPDDLPPIRIGPYALRVDPTALAEWADGFSGDRKPRAIVADLRDRLGMPAASREPTPAVERPTDAAEIVPIDSLRPFPGNARQGDVGAISESLRRFGQFRPVVANRRDSTILVGNHTWQAARMLRWSRIAVCWVDVDEIEAARIVAVDNRTSDLATYNDDALGSLLAALPTLDGTGYTPSDLDDLLADAANGGTHRKAAPTAKVTCVVGPWGWKAARDVWDRWEAALRPEIDDGSIYSWIAHSLTLPDNCWTPEAP